MVRVTIPMLYECPAVGTGFLRRKSAILKAQVTPEQGVFVCRGVAETFGVRLGTPIVDILPDELNANGSIRKVKPSFRLAWSV